MDAKVDLDAVLDAALDYTLAEEGGWSNHPKDRGGATKYGITLGVFQGLGREADLDGDGKVDAADLRKLTQEHARNIYRRLYWAWDKLGPSVSALLSSVHPAVMVKQFDTAVNMGPKAAVKLLQRAVNRVRGELLIVDGELGPKTVAAIASCRPDALLDALCELQRQRYEEIVARDESQAVFIRGWTKRAARKPSLEMAEYRRSVA